MALLLSKNVTVPDEYLDFANVFLEKSANVLLKQTKINKHTIKLEKAKKTLYGPIYSLRRVEFKTFKTYIKTNLANSFIQGSKLSATAPILIVYKLNNSFCLFVDY